jgi:ribosomal protein S18 acetylase RimI-like enzyme
MPTRLIEQFDEQKLIALNHLIFDKQDGHWAQDDFYLHFSSGTCFAYYEEENPEQLLGYVFLRHYPTYSYVSNLGIKKKEEWENISKELMKMVILTEIEQTKKRAFSIKLQVRTENVQLLNFYHSLGFVENLHIEGWTHMEASSLPKMFQGVSLTAPSLRFNPSPKHQGFRLTLNHFFSFNVLVSLISLTLGGAFIAIGIICAVYPLVGLGVGVCAWSLAAFTSHMFFAGREKNRLEHPLDYSPAWI